MKFWNKQHEVRKRCWVKIELPQEDHGIGIYPPYARQFTGWYRREQFENFKRELQRNPCKGKFYMSIMNKEIWFDHAPTASYFALKWN